MIFALVLMWWHLQRAVTCIDRNGKCWTAHPHLWRLGLLLVLFALGFGPRCYYWLTGAGFVTDTVPMILSFVWMIMVMWFCTVALAMDAWNCGVVIIQALRHKLDAKQPCHGLASPRCIAFCASAFTLIALLSGLYTTRHPRVVYQDFSSAIVPKDADGYRMLLISDLHLKQEHYPEVILDAVERAIASEKPDVIVHAGDFIDGPWSRDVNKYTDRIAQWGAPDGKFASFGNHDGYSGWDVSAAWHERAGFTLLGQRSGIASAAPQPWLFLAASDDESVWGAWRYGEARAKLTLAERRKQHEEIRARVENLPVVGTKQLGVLLRHQPKLPQTLAPEYKMMLSGHTHGGQVFPFNFVVYATYGLRTGVPQLARNVWIYICRGTGFWGPPLRFLEPPEIVIITFHPEQ
jgi:uncharacterized protein